MSAQTQDEVDEATPIELHQTDDDARAGQFAAMLSGGDKEPTPAEPAEEAEVADEVDDESSQPETVEDAGSDAEGPSEMTLALADSVNVPQEIIDAATTDDELLQAIRMARHFRPAQPEPKQEPAQAAEPDFAFEWPEGEVDKDDPVVKNLERLREHYEGKLQATNGVLKKLVDDYVAPLMEARESQETERELAEQQEFDAMLDEFNDPKLGKSDTLVRGKSKEWQERGKLYAQFHKLTRELGWSKDEAKQALALKRGVKLPEPKSQTVRRQAVKRLGGGDTRNAPKDPPSREQRWEALIADLAAK